ncbi:hypothetical protein [Geotalea sp. SG265]|uniref:hypothetical protein n=1 Tax=Geotalea sp. SG265 TaxID=2922867 RepID=UPI001FAF4B7D|nr:hypothetical protein [Geotalea sp. SG265]
MKTAEECTKSRKQLVDAMNWLDNRRRNAGERIAEIEAGYPQLLVLVAEGEREERELDDLQAELTRLRGIVAEPIDKAKALITGKVKVVDESLQKIRSIQSSRNEDLEFRKFFNEILRKGQCSVSEEERLRNMAGAARKALIDRLFAEMGEYHFRAAGPGAVRFEDVVTIQPFSEEPDTGVIMA